MSKVLTIFGATGNQGGSVIDAILADTQLSKEFKVRGITRNISKKSAQDLAQRGVDVVKADLDSVDSLTKALKGSHTVFLVTNYWEIKNPEVEFSQGKNVADVSKAVGVSHLIFSSLHHVAEATKGRLSHVPHFDSKANVEKYIRGSGVECSFVLPGYYMSNFIKMLTRAEDGSYQLFYPDKRILAAVKYYGPEEIVDTFSKVTGKKAVFSKVAPEEYKASLPPAMADEYLENHLFVEEPGYYLGEPLEPSLRLLDAKPTTWEEFVKRNASAWKYILL
ncbi:unnamed protein product [Penicillium egyptiacum]|uniref:NmrA-like domain-containing protein n=1 Tax=Penicillium egyptiacum TaxID=1303716 RepID=A0A9W4P7Z3_9EURO|nr:unnamed protein product [Penicillium egyptiacum]